MRNVIVAAAVLLFCAGCRSQSIPSAGTVRFDDGEPVRSGSIEFRSIFTGNRYASRIDAEGGFLLQDEEGNEGIEAGEYEVVVVQIVLTEDLALEEHSHGRTVPRRYADYFTSGLRSTVKEAQTSPISIVLSGDIGQ